MTQDLEILRAASVMEFDGGWSIVDSIVGMDDYLTPAEDSDGCYLFGRLLDPLLDEDHCEYSDHEFCCCYWYFPTRECAERFVAEANKKLTEFANSRGRKA